jgi:acyl-CoA synthetase (NDP forming)
MFMGKLTNKEAFQLLEKYTIHTARHILTKDEKTAVAYAKKIGYPVVLKLSSPDIIHKTDAKAVLVGIENEQELRSGFRKLISIGKKKKARVEGVLVQEQVKGTEIIIGSSQDPQFGPTLLFGLGGIFVEVLKDVTFRLIPIDRKEAAAIIKEIKGYKILAGVRGEKPVNFRALETCLVNVSNMVWSARPQIKELDINPLFANEQGVIAADVRVFV